MSPDTTDEHRALHDAAAAFARENLRSDDAARERDLERAGAFDAAGWRALGEFGAHGGMLSREYGGGGLSASAQIAVLEGLGYGGADAGLLFSLHAQLWTVTRALERFGTAAQKQRFLPGISAGTLVGANGASEPSAGSDVYAMTTRAEKRGDRYVLRGAKVFVTNAPVADVFVVFASTDPARGPLGISAFLVERGAAGLRIGPAAEKMGLRRSPMAEVWFDDCEVPAENLLHRAGRGAEVFEHSMEWERGCILASALGAMRRIAETCADHARTREQFGQPIGRFQSLANLVVGMRVRLETSRPLVYRFAALKDAGRDARLEASIAKLHVSECYAQTCLDALQVFGGYGYMVEQGIEREVRDALASRIYSGTTEIQRVLIARALGLA